MATCIHGTHWSGIGRLTCPQCLEKCEDLIYILATKDIDPAREKTDALVAEVARLKAVLAFIAIEPCCFKGEPCYGCYSCRAREALKK